MILKAILCVALVIVMAAVVVAPRDVASLGFKILALAAAVWAVLTS